MIKPRVNYTKEIEEHIASMSDEMDRVCAQRVVAQLRKEGKSENWIMTALFLIHGSFLEKKSVVFSKAFRKEVDEYAAINEKQDAEYLKHEKFSDALERSRIMVIQNPELNQWDVMQQLMGAEKQ